MTDALTAWLAALPAGATVLAHTPARYVVASWDGSTATAWQDGTGAVDAREWLAGCYRATAFNGNQEWRWWTLPGDRGSRAHNSGDLDAVPADRRIDDTVHLWGHVTAVHRTGSTTDWVALTDGRLERDLVVPVPAGTEVREGDVLALETVEVLTVEPEHGNVVVQDLHYRRVVVTAD